VADNDIGFDIFLSSFNVLMKEIKKDWKKGKGHLRANEMNWTNSENV